MYVYMYDVCGSERGEVVERRQQKTRHERGGAGVQHGVEERKCRPLCWVLWYIPVPPSALLFGCCSTASRARHVPCAHLHVRTVNENTVRV